MRYVNVGGEVIPKHCKFGPRPKEGIVFNNYEWWSITDHLVREQREKEIAAVLKAKDEAKKEISFDMTRNWSNTMASIKTQGNQKRMEKMEKIKRDKIEAYNRILQNRKEEKKKILDDVKKVLFEQKDITATLNSAILFSQVLDERRKQIEEKNLIKKAAAKMEEEWITKVKKDAQEEKREKLEEVIKERQKLKIQKLYLDEQVADRRKRKEKELAEMAAEKQDLINMKIEGEKIHNCNMVERDYRKKFTARYMKKSANQLEYERNVALEEIEEDEINKIFQEYDRKFKTERKEREERIKNEEIEKRVKRAEILAQELSATKQKEEERVLSAIFEKERKEKQLEEEKEEIRRQGIADLLEGKRKAEERQRKEFYERKEEKKWEMMQQYRRSEINLEWRKTKKKQKEELHAERVKELDLQCKELQERRAEEKREWEESLEDEAKDKAELRQYCEEVLQFAKDEKLPQYPILQTVMKVKKENNLFNEKELEEMKRLKGQGMKNENEKRRSRVMAAGCYCLRD